MAGVYDEDLHENPFFKTLVEKHRQLFARAEEGRCTICVPRYETVASMRLGKSDFESHILQELEKNKLRSFNNKVVIVESSAILTTKDGYKENRSVRILFEEIFFNSRDESYQVLCIDRPLEGGVATQQELLVVMLKTAKDCEQYLWHSAAPATRESVDSALSSAIEQDISSARSSVDAVDALFSRSLQCLSHDPQLKKHLHGGEAKKRTLKMALEAYVMKSVHGAVFSEICSSSAREDEALNKLTRSLQDIGLVQLGIDRVFGLNLKEAKDALSRLNHFCTPLEKLACLNEALSMMSRTPADSAIAVAADELIPLAAFLLLRSDIPNWTANLSYLKKFNPSHVMEEKHRYCLTTFEVALEYLRSGDLITTDSVDPASAPQLLPVHRFERSDSSHGRSDASFGTSDQAMNEFFEAVIAGDLAAVHSILDAKSGSNALCHPLCMCPRCTELIKRLDNVPTARSRDHRGRTALHFAAKLGYAEMVEILMKHGALVNAPDHNGTTPLHLACQKGMQKAVLLLLDCGAHINAVDSARNTPLHLACSHGHDKVVNALVFNRRPKCKIDAVNDEGNTPLHNATRWGFASVVRQLLIHGAELEVVNSDQQTPLDCAHSRVREALHHRRASISHKATGSASAPQPPDNPVKRRHRKGHDREVNRLLSAAEAGDMNLIRFLLDWGAKLSSPMKQPELCHPMCQCKKCLPYTEARLNVNLHDSEGMTALHKACLHGHANLAKELVDHGALTDVQTSTKLFTPLHYSCIYNRHECVSVLLGAGASVNMNDINGSTPLHNCAISGNLTSAENLLAHKANPNAKDSKGNTPLHHAARWAHKGLVSVLLTHGADYLIRNSDEQTAEEVTKDEEVLEVFQKVHSGQLHTENMTPALLMPKPVEVTSKGSVQSL